MLQSENENGNGRLKEQHGKGRERNGRKENNTTIIITTISIIIKRAAKKFTTESKGSTETLIDVLVRFLVLTKNLQKTERQPGALIRLV